ncbi:ParB/RepB/Spo0J family partition protein [Raineyella fluvialis]|uniref:ParB/RepB/Spo0J family partition protein n=1 Tax=Raineyella fluvialis TaxID=2662261 RepID=A0A5Q2FDY4_9ACTN|nr:ParB/RepB/Spo0J family partition protein [Raineyella fluvialis]QGF23303.1 ParB/RepB/Spo0J family partition protein [Raineyella fluvialis]
MVERRAGLGRGLGELFQRTDLDSPPHPVDQHVIVDPQRGQSDLSPTGVDLVVGGSRRADDGPESEQITAGAPLPQSGPADEPTEPTDAPAVVDPANGYYADIPIERIHPNPRQPRQIFEEAALQELVGSIREVGLLQPIVVRQDGEDSYELVMGERRWRASSLAGLETVPSIVRETADDDMLRDALLENIHRVQLNPLEEAAAYQQLMEDFGCTQLQLGERIRRSRSQIANTIRLLNLPPALQRQVASGALSAGHARALLGLQDRWVQERLARRIITEGLSVRATEELVARELRGGPRPGRRSGRDTDPRLLELSSELGSYFDTRVEVTRGAKKGKIVMEFTSEEDLERLMGLLRQPADQPATRTA